MTGLPFPLWLLANYLILQLCSLAYWIDPKTRTARVCVMLYWFWAVYLLLRDPTSGISDLTAGGVFLTVWLTDRWIYSSPPAWLLRLKTPLLPAD